MLKSRLLPLFAGLCITAAHAQAINPLATRDGFEVGGQISDYKYDEPDFAKLTGTKLGVAGAFTHTYDGGIFARSELRLSYGELDYEGSGTMSNVPDSSAEFRMVGGGDIFLGSSVSLTPYAGLGYRYLYNDLRGETSTGALGYRRYSQYLYIPLGVTMRVAAGAGWVVAPTIEYDYFIRGRQRSMLTDTGIGFSDASNRQKHGHGARASLMIEKDQFAFGPWIHTWKIGESEPTDIGFGFVGFEPANETTEAGVEFKYRF
jgi:hypothetical protein